MRMLNYEIKKHKISFIPVSEVATSLINIESLLPLGEILLLRRYNSYADSVGANWG